MASKKGFFFMVISFILLIYIFAYLSAWASALEMKEKAYSERFRGASIHSTLSSLDSRTLSEFFKIGGQMALFKINNFSIEHPLKYDDNNKILHLKNAFFELLVNGTSDEFKGPKLQYSNKELSSYSLKGFLDVINKTLLYSSLVIENYEVSDLRFEQVGRVSFNASLNLTINISDKWKQSVLQRSFHLSHIFNVSGFPDPMITREFNKKNIKDDNGNIIKVEKQIYYRADVNASDLAPVKLFDAEQGAGFFYGPIVSVDEVNNLNEHLFPRYIVYGTFDELRSLGSNLELFGGVIQTSEPTHLSSDCPESEDDVFNALVYEKNAQGHCELTSVNYQLNVPFIVSTTFDPNDPKLSGPNGEKRVLFIARRSVEEVINDPEEKLYPGAIYNVENLRDYVICSYYINSTRGPSYVQRLSENAPQLSDVDFGLETTLLGRWAGGSYLSSEEGFSRVAFEFLQNIGGVKIRGMPGCKNHAMCSSSNNNLGHFRLSDDSLSYYNADVIACNDGNARCD